MTPGSRRVLPFVVTIAVLLWSMPPLAAAAEQHTLPGGQSMEVEVYPGVSRWKLIPHLWTHKTVNVTCPGTSDFSVYVASHPAKLADEFASKHTAWCGLAHSLSWESHSCVTRISPYQETAVAVVKPGWKIGGRACSFEVAERLWLPWLVQGAAGALLFWHADSLVESQAFRLSSGTAGFVLLSLLIVVFIIYRSVPNKKHMAAAATLFGSSFLGLVKYFFGTWIPSFDQLVTNKWALMYMLASALIGLAVTYYYDDPANEKLNTILKHGLQLAGLVAIAFSTAAPEVSVAAALALVAARIAQLPQAQEAIQKLAAKRQKLMAKRHDAVVAAYGEDAAPAGSRRPGKSPAQPVKHEPADEVPSGVEEALTGGANSQQTAATGSTAVAGLSTPQERRLMDEEAPISPLVERGYIMNEATGRTILIGKMTYNKLVKEGYEVDRQKGVMTPPGGRTSGAGPASPRKSGGRAKKGGSVTSPRVRTSALSSASGLPLPD